MEKFDHKKIEPKWQKLWEEKKLHRADDDSDKKKKYILDMFPYPSGAGLHVGHVESYTATDIYCRYLRMNGFNVLHPQGWDAFGLPAENYAIQTGVHPHETTGKAIATFKKQMNAMGFSYDWSREVNSSDPEYYKWTQWFFLFLYKNGLAYKKKAKVNWCDSCQTVLANEQAEGGKCDRCGSLVIQKDLEQWFFRITEFLEDQEHKGKKIKGLLGGLDDIDWPESTKLGQKNWIGRSEGAIVKFFIPAKGNFLVRLGFKTQPNQKISYPGFKIQSSNRIFWFLTFSTKKRFEFFEGKNECLLIINSIFQSCIKHNFTLHELSVLHSHVHIIIDTDRNIKIDKIYKYLKGYSSNRYIEKFNLYHKNSKGKHIWTPKGDYQIIKNEKQYNKIINYVKENPEKDRLSKKERLYTENIDKLNFEIEIFTTRPDTLFGATYFVLSPEHPLVNKITTEEQKPAVEKYIYNTSRKTELERTDLFKDKTGVFTGAYAINPVNNEEIPVFIADYVLMEYGTGAIMAVPAHDQRDHEFAKKYGLKIIEVVKGGEDVQKEAYTGDGTSVNSEILNGLDTNEAKKKITQWLEEKNLGKAAVNYKIRDWLVSRQRYWGAPIPIIYCDTCGEVPVPEDDLLVVLPEDVDFKPTGESPLNYSKTFQKVKCPKCGRPARRESDTMDTFVCSSWYYLRYSDPKNYKEFAGKERLKQWLPVDVYVGGAEHTVLHLLYSRFFTKALQKYGYIDFNEPFLKLRHQGIILAEDGTKMSKSKGNVINPDEVVAEYGADTLRMYEMFMGPLEDAKPWSTKGIIGIRRFLDRVWRLGARMATNRSMNGHELKQINLNNILHKTIKKVGEDIKVFKFNTAIAQMMIFVNELEKRGEIEKEQFELFLRVLAPFAPHLSEEMWRESGNQDSIFKETWPEYDPELVKDETIKLVIQVNGKLRDTIEVDAGIEEEEAKKVALKSGKIKKWIKGKEIIKVVFVKGRLVNIVVK